MNWESRKSNRVKFEHKRPVNLMGADGKYLGFFPPGTAPERVAQILRQQIAPMP